MLKFSKQRLEGNAIRGTFTDASLSRPFVGYVEKSMHGGYDVYRCKHTETALISLLLSNEPTLRAAIDTGLRQLTDLATKRQLQQ